MPNVDNLSLSLNQLLPLLTCDYQPIPINLHKTTCTNSLNQHVLCINLDSSRCTNIINYTPHVCSNSSTTCLNHVPNMYLNHIPKTYNNITIKRYLIIHHSIHKPNTINPYIKPCATTSLLCSLKLNQQLQQHITTKRPIPICQIPTISLNKYDICSNIEHPIPSQELNPSSQTYLKQDVPYLS
jgi:hypothetical protein